MDFTPFTVSRNGVLFIANREALVLTAYQDGPHCSIGFGSNSPALKLGDRITVKHAFDLLKTGIAARSAELNKRLDPALYSILTQAQYDAAMSLYYQSGTRYMPVSPRDDGDNRPDILRLINAQKFDEAADSWPDCDQNLAGEHISGLRKRRVMEQGIFVHGEYGVLDLIPYWPDNPRTTRMQQYKLQPGDV